MTLVNVYVRSWTSPTWGRLMSAYVSFKRGYMRFCRVYVPPWRGHIFRHGGSQWLKSWMGLFLDTYLDSAYTSNQMTLNDLNLACLATFSFEYLDCSQNIWNVYKPFSIEGEMLSKWRGEDMVITHQIRAYRLIPCPQNTPLEKSAVMLTLGAPHICVKAVLRVCSYPRRGRRSVMHGIEVALLADFVPVLTLGL